MISRTDLSSPSPMKGLVFRQAPVFSVLLCPPIFLLLCPNSSFYLLLFFPRRVDGTSLCSFERFLLLDYGDYSRGAGPVDRLRLTDPLPLRLVFLSAHSVPILRDRYRWYVLIHFFQVYPI